MAASGELGLSYGDLFKDGLRGMLAASSGKGSMPEADAPACAVLGHEHDQPRGQGLDVPAAPTGERWEVAPTGLEKEGVGLRLLCHDGSVFAAPVVFREHPLGARAEPGEQDTVARVDRAPADSGPDPVPRYGPADTPSYLALAVWWMLGLGPNRRGWVTVLDHGHSGNLAGATREARSAADDGRPPPLRSRHKDGLRIYVEKVEC